MLNGQTPNYLRRFTGNGQLVRIVSSVDAIPGLSNKTIIQQRLTIMNNGAISFISTTKDRDIAESLNFDVDTQTAKCVIDKISRFFSKTVDSKRYPVVGNYDLTITNDEGDNFYFDGSLNNNYTIDGDNISDYVRKALNLPQLFVFEDSGMKKELKHLEIHSYKDDETVIINADKGELTYSCGSNYLRIENAKVITAFLEKYNEKISPNLNFASVIGSTWDYDLRASYSYGEDLKFGGTKAIGNTPYFWKEMMSEIKSIIHSNLFKTLFNNQNLSAQTSNNNDSYKIALVSSNELNCSTWYRAGQIEVYIDDYVLVPDNFGKYIIGKVIQTKYNQDTSTYRSTYKNIIKKL